MRLIRGFIRQFSLTHIKEENVCGQPHENDKILFVVKIKSNL